MHNAIRLPAHPPLLSASKNIIVMPPIAAIIASQVRGATFSPRKRRPHRAATKGEMLPTTSVLATVVSDRARMKLIIIPANSSPDTTPGQPMA